MPATATTPPRTITIAARFCGPPESGNGGYTCGSLAAGMKLPVEVTLRRPPPLDRPLAIQHSLEGRVLADGDVVVAEARRCKFELELPPCPGLGAAAAASAAYPGLHAHAFPTCFVCGPDRSIGDGLRIFAGEVEGDTLVASPWKPSDDLAGEDGLVRSEFVWAALDCPGAWAWLPMLADPVVLGRLSVVIDTPIEAGRLHIVGGWRMGNEGRKHYAGTVIWGADGTVCARGRATWIAVDAAKFAANG